MNNITRVIFDFDGTLADSQGYWTTLNPTILRQRGYPVDDGDFEKCKTAALPDWEYLKKKYGLSDADCPTFEETMEYIDNFYRTEMKLKPGVLEFLNYLKDEKIPMAVFSATRESSVRLGLACLGIDSYFDAVISAGDWGTNKGHKETYFRCLDLLGAAPERSIMVEDALYSIKTAKSIGMTVYAIAEPCFASHEEEIRSLVDRYAEKSMTEFLD
ncbi:MAG: HAD family phosphatase [Clostridia bacterium]|nr:HAD family phosphatase [Clostridia bacterium]